jgi:hypothetical protein
MYSVLLLYRESDKDVTVVLEKDLACERKKNSQRITGGRRAVAV